MNRMKPDTERVENPQERARRERLDVLAGTRGDKKDHALRHGDLDGPIADLVERIVLEELRKRGL